MLVLAGMAGAVILLVVLMPPNTMGPQPETVTPVTVGGFVAYLVGLGAMIRIYRGTFEPTRSSFRATRD